MIQLFVASYILEKNIYSIITLSIKYCLFIFIQASHVKYFEQEKTWFEAQRTCNNLRGWLTSNKNNVINCNQVTGSIQGATFWTGEYSTISHWISKIGKFFFKPSIEFYNVTEIIFIFNSNVYVLGYPMIHIRLTKVS